MGGGAVMLLASDHLLSRILCRGQSSGAVVWRCDWLRKGEMKTTVNFWPPAQELCRNAQLWRGGTEPALFLCLLHQSNGDGGERGRRRQEHREGGEKDTGARGREEGKRENRRRCGLKMNICFFTEWHSWNVYTIIHTASKKTKLKPSTVFHMHICI